MTTQEYQVAILSELWLKYSHEEGFEDFIEYNDIGLPLAFMIENGLATPTESGEKAVTETFDLLLASLNIKDKGYTNLDEVLGGA